MDLTADQEIAQLKLALAKREWLLETVERHRGLVPAIAGIERRRNIGSQEFLERYYAPGRPVILQGELEGWPALERWTPDYLKARIGSTPVEYQGDRTSNARFELEKDQHRREGPFDAFIESIERSGEGNNAYITAYNSERNGQALAPLADDVGFLEKFLTRDPPSPIGMLWIGPAGTMTPLHHDLTNNFIVQLAGRKKFTILPAAMVGRVYNHRHVFSQIPDLDDPALDVSLYPRLAGALGFQVVLAPGEIIFMPLAWWHQVKSLDFSVSATFTNFIWPNDGYATYPGG